MKKSLPFIVLLAFSTLLFGQNTFQRHFGAPSNYDGIDDFIATSDGAYLIGGTTANYGAGRYDMLFEKIDTNGNLLWQQTWGNEGDDGVNSIIQIDSTGYLVCGYSGGGIAEERNFVVLRLDEQGEEVWKIIRNNAFSSEAISAVKLADGSFVIGGHWVINTLDGPGTIFLKIDGEGNVLWEQVLEFNTLNRIVNLVATLDGGFFILVAQKQLYKYDAQGTFVFQKEITSINGNVREINHFERTADGQLRISGIENFSQPFIAELDESGNMTNIREFSELIQNIPIKTFSLTSSGKIWLASDFMVVLYDPVLNEVTNNWFLSIQPGFEDLDEMVRIMARAEDDVVLATNTRSGTKGRNGLLLHADGMLTEEWRKVVGLEMPDDSESARMIVETADGGFLLGGYQFTNSGSQDIWVIRTDALGSVLWSSHLGGPEEDRIAALTTLSDSTYVVAGYHGNTVILSRIDDSGTTQWYKEFEVNLVDGTFGMTAITNDDIVLALPVSYELQSAGKLMKVNAQGDSIWSKYYFSEEGFRSTYGIAESEDGGFYICGCGESENGNGFFPLLLKTNSEGNVIWSNLYEENNNIYGCLIQVHSDGAGSVYSHGINSNNSLKPYLLKCASDGAMQWSQVLQQGDEVASYFPWFSGLQPNLEQLALFGIKTFADPLQAGGDRSGTITLLNLEGEVLNEVDHGLDKSGGFLGGIFITDGGFAVVGSAVYENSNDAWLVKTLGDATVSYITNLKPPFELTIAPNPVGNELNFKIAGLEVGTAQLLIFDVNGRQLTSLKLSVDGGYSSFSIPIDHLNPGAYFLQVSQGGRYVTKQWLKH